MNVAGCSVCVVGVGVCCGCVCVLVRVMMGVVFM